MDLKEQIKAAFAELDKKSLADLPGEIENERYVYYRLKLEILHAFHFYGRNSSECCTLRERQKVLFSKSFRNNYDWGFDEHVARASKSLKKAHDDRNERIVRRMEKYGITKIDFGNFKVIDGEDFTGIWIIDGHEVSIKVIWAGGHNIHGLRPRVLANVKANKEAA